MRQNLENFGQTFDADNSTVWSRMTIVISMPLVIYVHPLFYFVRLNAFKAVVLLGGFQMLVKIEPESYSLDL